MHVLYHSLVRSFSSFFCWFRAGVRTIRVRSTNEIDWINEIKNNNEQMAGRKNKKCREEEEEDQEKLHEKVFHLVVSLTRFDAFGRRIWARVFAIY